MSAQIQPRVVLITRPTDYELLVATRGTREQARFFLSGRGQSLDDLDERHHQFQAALKSVRDGVPARWRFAHVERADLPVFVFEPSDIVVVLGQDGLVANAAKYLDGQVVIGVNPEPKRFPGVLVPHPVRTAARLIRGAAAGDLQTEDRTMAEAVLDDGQCLLALNEVFVGHISHQSARYRIAFRGKAENHSSSGLIVATGTGATGWALSISRSRSTSVGLPGPTEARLAFFVREAWPSKATGTNVVTGEVLLDEELTITSSMNEGGVVFCDGIEPDRLVFPWGVVAHVRVAQKKLRLVKRAG